MVTMFRARARRDFRCVANIFFLAIEMMMFRSFVLDPSTLPLRLVASNLLSKSITVYTSEFSVACVYSFTVCTSEFPVA